ncbi:MAG: serine hydrolase [Candidatus Paceibacterota bacterium]
MNKEAERVQLVALTNASIAAKVVPEETMLVAENEPKKQEEVRPLEVVEPKPKEPPFAQLASLLYSQDGNEIALNDHKRWPLASLTKIMTAVIALENFSPEETITISQTAVDEEGVSGGLNTQEIYSVHDLIAAMMTVSSNDAAMAIATPFGFEYFVELMNAKANEIGMYNTQFDDPVGLSYLNQSTLSDIRILAQYVLANHPQIFSAATQSQTILVEHSTGANRVLGTINKFAQRPDFLGGKTGYTDEAKGNLVSLFNIGASEPLIVIVLGSNDRFADSEALLTEYSGTR